MRVSKRLYLPLVGIAAFLVFAIAGFPLALALDVSGLKRQGLSWSAAEGTLWSGRVADLYIDSFPIGTVRQSTGLLALATGRIASDVEILGRSVNGEGDITLSGSAVTLRDAAYTVDLAPFNLLDAFGAPMRGTVRIETGYFSVGEDGCRGGDVSLWTDTLTYSAAVYGGEGFPVSGQARCTDDGATLVDLSGSGDGRSVRVEARVEPALDYIAEITVTGMTGEEADALALYGFEPRDDGSLVLIQQGHALLRE